MNQTEAFHQRIDSALQKTEARHNFRTTMTGLMDRRREQFPEPDELQSIRDQARAIRHHSLTNQADLLERLEAKLVDNGIQVHWAETATEANEIILQILQQANAKSVVKGKSMVSEETELNHHLEQHGIDVLESDLGEFLR